MNTCWLAAVTNTPHDDTDTGSNHDDDGGNFKEREPELQFAKHFHAHQVDGTDNQYNAQNPDPMRHCWEPEPHIDTEGGNIRNRYYQDFKTVGPASDVTRQRAKVILRVTRK